MEEKIPGNKLEKLSENKYKLTTTFEKVMRTDEFDKAFLKESYNSGVSELNRVLDQLNALNKRLKGHNYTKVEVDEIEDFIRLNNKAKEYGDYKKMLDQRDNALDMIKRLRAQKDDIEKVLPELTRKKK